MLSFLLLALAQTAPLHEGPGCGFYCGTWQSPQSGLTLRLNPDNTVDLLSDPPATSRAGCEGRASGYMFGKERNKDAAYPTLQLFAADGKPLTSPMPVLYSRSDGRDSMTLSAFWGVGCGYNQEYRRVVD